MKSLAVPADDEVPPGVVTVTSTVPCAAAGVNSTISVSVTDSKVVTSTDPNDTVVRPSRFVPVIVTVVPPSTEPCCTDSDVTVGTAK